MVLQMLVFIPSNYGGLIVFCVVTVLLEYLTDCSIRVSRSCFIVVFFWGGGVPHLGSATGLYGLVRDEKVWWRKDGFL